MQSRRGEATQRRPARESDCDLLPARLASLLDDDAEPNQARGVARDGVYADRDLLAGSAGERQPGDASTANTLALYLTKLARLGGYLARSKDPPPGNTVMWRGMTRLTDIQLGFILGTQLVGN